MLYLTLITFGVFLLFWFGDLYLTLKTVKHLAIQYHLFHKKLERDNSNLKLLNKVIQNKTTFTPFGITKTEQ